MTTNEIAVRPQHSLTEKMEFAKALAQAGMIPRTYQSHPANVLVAIELGEALNIAPIVAINEINVINGTPSLSASLMASLARAAGHRVRVTGDAESATCEIIRADDPDYTHTATWDVNKAKAAQLWNKGHWAKDPATMLKWRAVSEGVRFACSEVLGGVKYTPDEVADFSGAPVQAKAERPTITEALAEPVQEQPTVDPETLMAAVEAATTKDELRELWGQSAHAPEHARSAIRQRITEQLADIEALAAQGAEAEQPTLDGELVEDDAATPTEGDAA